MCIYVYTYVCDFVSALRYLDSDNIVVLFLLTTSFKANICCSKQTLDVLKQHKQINTTIETQFLFCQGRKFDLL